jgi:hypothetical protein
MRPLAWLRRLLVRVTATEVVTVADDLRALGRHGSWETAVDVDHKPQHFCDVESETQVVRLPKGVAQVPMPEKVRRAPWLPWLTVNDGGHFRGRS